ncbi:MAG: hypothetical protein K2Q23_17490, partial [Bryobacteraceae bacterium]|nr:hypothetical protein [Bryobacteraceae bacterium]
MAGRAARTTYPTTYTQAAAPPFSPTNPNAWVAVVGPRFELSYDGSNRMSGETKADWNGAAYGSPATLVSGVADNINSQ